MSEFSKSPLEHLKEAEELLGYGSRTIGGHLNEDSLAYTSLANAHISLANAMFTMDQLKLANDQLKRANELLEQ